MSSEITVTSSDARFPAGGTPVAVFYRLYGDLIEQLNIAVRKRVAEGHTQATLAKAADQDPAVLSRVLSGQSGTNLRTIAAVLYATSYRLKITATPLDELVSSAETARLRDDGGVVQMIPVGGKWMPFDIMPDETGLPHLDEKRFYTEMVK